MSRFGRCGGHERLDEANLRSVNRSGVALQPLKPPHVALSFADDEDTQRDLEQMEEDEDEMRRANSEVMQMQKRMLEGLSGHSRSSSRSR